MATITVSKPQAGRQATIQAQAGQTIQLNFTPDQAFPERTGDDLIFRFQDGSSTRIAGFFTDLTRETLPDFVLPDQTTLSGVDFFTAINPDLLPASGGSSGGMGDYRDDAGNLVDGLNAMDPLNPVFWGSTAEVPPVAAGIEYPGADIDIRIDTEIPSAGMTFTNAVFEDARPFQNLTGEAGAEIIPGILHIALNPTGTTTVDGLVLWGFAEGTVLDIGGRIVTIGSPDDRVPLTPAEIAMEIRVYAPDNDSDADMQIHYEVTLSTADVPGVIVPGEFTLVVDAVADKPTAGEGFVEESLQDFTKNGADWSYNEDGSRSLRAGELQALTFGVQAGFTDNDGSERHTIVVRGIPSDAGWTLDSTAGGLSGYTQVASAAQSTAGTYWIEADGSWHFNVGNTTDSISGELVFKPGDWTNDGAPINIELFARADEVRLSGREVSLDNNTAETPLGKYQVELLEDSPEFISKNGSITISSDETAGVQTSAEVAAIGDLKNAAAVADVLEDLGLDGKNPVSIAQQNIKYDLFSDGSDDIGLSSPSQLALRFEGVDGTDSGWKTTAGDPIFLYFEDGAAVGRTAAGDIAFVAIAADNDGNLAGGFNNGTVSFIQYMSLQHPTGGSNQDSHNEKMFLSEPLKLVLHDDDGQIATLDVNLNVHDDGPKIINICKAHALDETFARDFNHDGAWDHFSTSGRVVVNFGADGPADVPFKLDVSGLKEMGLASGGVELTINDSDPTNIVAKAGDKVIFTLTIDENGAYKYSQFGPLDHPQDGPTRADHDDPLRLPFKVIATDGDGDFVTRSQAITVEDDGPKLLNHKININLAEADLPGGSDPLHIIDNVHGNIGNESIFHGFIGFAYGADGPASLDGPAQANPFSWDVAKLEGFQTYGPDHKPVDVVWEPSADGLTVIGYAEGDADKTPVITIKATLVPGGATYIVDQDAPLIHDGLGRDNLKLEVPFRITDGDGDYTNGKLTINIQDDIPCAGTCDINDMVFEASLRDGGEISTTGHLVALFGADGPADNPVYWNQASITDEVKNFNAIIDGEHVELTVEFGSDGRTFTIYGPDNALVAEGAISQDANGHWTYSYKQYEPIEHNATGLGDIAKKLDLGYVVQDGDGDKAYNDLDITIVDSRALFGYGYGQFDETDARVQTKDAGWLTGSFGLTLDYDAPDGIADVNWNQALVQKSLDVYNQQTPAEADGFTCTVSEDGSLLTISQHGRAVLELTLVRGADGTYTVEYNQLGQMDHPLGAQVFGLSHDEPIPFVLPINVVDGDKDTTLGTVVIRVDDDGPDPSVGSNVTILEVMGNAILEGLGDLDLANPQAFFDSIGKAFMEGLGAGFGNEAAVLDLIDLILNTNVRNNAPGELPFIGADSDRTEKAGQVYTAQLKGPNPDADGPTFGADGPAAEGTAVTWSKESITALFKLIGLHATGHGGEELTVDPVDGSAQHLLVKSGGIDLLRLEINDQGEATITQLAPLGHNASALSGLLSGLADQILGNSDLMQGLEGIDPAKLLTALDGGNILALPLPVIITDHDGDKAPGLISIIIRDSIPVQPGAVHAHVGESDLPDGRFPYPVNENNVPENPNADETTHGGTFTVNFGYDGPHGDTPFQWDKPADGLYKTSEGVNIVWKYVDDDHPTTLVGYAGNTPVITISGELAGNTVSYTVTLHESIQHATGGNENILDLPVSFTIRDGDGDTASNTLTVHVKDDIPDATDNYDKLDTPAAGQPWTATGNVISGTGTTSAAGGSEQAAADKFGADGRMSDGTDAKSNPVGGLLVQNADGKWEVVTPDAPLTIEGTYGDLVINHDGSYTYTVIAERMQGVLDNAELGPRDIQVNLKGENPIFQGLEISAFNTGNTNGNTPNGTPGGWTAASLAKTADGLGVNSGLLSQDGDIGGVTSAANREGVLITFPDPVNKADISFGDLESKAESQVIGAGSYNLSASWTLVEQVKLVFYDAAGNKLGEKTYSGDADGVVNSGAFPDGITGVSQIAIIGMPPLVSGITVDMTGVPSYLQGIVRGAAEAVVKGLAPAADDGFNITGISTTKMVPASPEDLTETFDYKIIDKDGDESTAQLIINANAKPGAPSAIDAAATVSETDLATIGSDSGQGFDNRGDGVDDDNETTFHGDFNPFDFGPEGANDTTPFTWNKPAGDLFTDLNGNAVTWTVEDNGLRLVGTANNVIVITITANGVTGDSPSYDVVLAQPIKHIDGSTNLDDLDFNITFTIADRSGDTASGSINVNILDDNPEAYDDIRSLAENPADQTIGGNVVTGVVTGNADAAQAADLPGADNATQAWNASTTAKSGDYTLVAGGTAGVYDVQNDSGVSVGTLTLGAGGAYSFTLNAGYDLDGATKIVVPYSLTDGDNDISNADLIINLTGATTKPIITVDQAEGKFYEAGLDARGTEPAGSGIGDTLTSRTGTLTVDTDGFPLQTLTIGGQTVTITNGASGQVLLLNEPSDNDTTPLGKLTIGNITFADGKYTISYTLELNDNTLKNGTADADFSWNVVATTQAGAQTGSIGMTVADDSPMAYDDALTLARAEQSVSGSVLDGEFVVDLTGRADTSGTEDTYGADGKSATNALTWNTTVTFTPEDGTAINFTVPVGTSTALISNGVSYGTILLNADGSYTYARPSGSIPKGDIQADYTIRDADGDTSPATLTIAVDASKPAILGITEGLAVHEDGLSVIGSNAGESGHDTVTSGTLTIESTDGLGSIEFSVGSDTFTITVPATWNGSAPYAVPAANGTFNAPYGQMVIESITKNASGNYEVNFHYTLKNASDKHSGDSSDYGTHDTDTLLGGDAIAKAAAPNIGVKVTDKHGGESDLGNIAVDILDDAPQLSLTPGDTAAADGSIHLGNSFMTSGSIEVAYGADQANGTGDDYLEVTFEGVRHVRLEGGLPDSGTAFNETKLVAFDNDGHATVYTGLGVIEFTKNLATGEVTYTYLAKHGLAGDSEKLTFTATDSDGDTAAQSASVKMTQDVPAGTSYVDEAGLLGLGSHHAGYLSPVMAFPVYLPEGTTDVAWDLAAIQGANPIKADADGDGTYSPVAWSVDGQGNLIATAEGRTILTVTKGTVPPVAELDESSDETGNYVSTFTVKLDYPIEHAASTSPYNTHGLYLGFKATSPGENGGTMVTSNAVSVAILDDAPLAQNTPLSIVEAVTAPEDVYMVLDISGSISNSDLAKAQKALSALVQEYINKGIDAQFTLITFGSGGTVVKEHLSATLMKAFLDNSSTSLRSGTENTNYDAGLDTAQRLIEAAQQDGTTRFYDQKVYFISDGAANRGLDRDFSSWQQFVKAHQGEDKGHDQVEVYAVGVGDALTGESSANNWNKLMTVTADSVTDHGIKVENYGDLANKLTALVNGTEAKGNLLGIDIDNNDVRSADLTEVVSVTFAGVTKAPGADGTITFDHVSGLTLVVNADGSYTITTSKSVTADASYDLSYTLKDGDGDTSTAHTQLVLRDARPEAFDNVAGGPDAAYKAASAANPHIVLDDFSAKSDWYGSRSDINYNVKFTTGNFINIDGQSVTLSNAHTFVGITAKHSTESEDAFGNAMRNIAGRTIDSLFSGEGNPRAGAYIEKSFDLQTAGSLKFNYIFSKGDSGSANERAFYVLLDAKGNVIASGQLLNGNDKNSGLQSINVAKAGHYTLLLGCYDKYTGGASTMPTLYVDKVVFDPNTTAGKNVYHGNVIEDMSPLGEIDRLADHAVLTGITLNGVWHAMVAGGIYLDLPNGDKLSVSETGNYSYQTTRESFDDINVSYTIKEPISGQLDEATLYIRSADHRIEGTSGNDVLYGTGGNDVIIGGDGHDTIYGGAGHDVIYGGAGNDLIHGGDGNDTIYGGDGNDIIYGGLGNDVMSGGSGADIFAWGKQDYDNGTDSIMDFTLREDRLSFSDIFGDEVQNNIGLKTILSALTDDKIDLTVTDSTHLSVTVNHGNEHQNVNITLTDGGLGAMTQTQIDTLNNDDAAKAALLQQMLTNIGG